MPRPVDSSIPIQRCDGGCDPAHRIGPIVSVEQGGGPLCRRISRYCFGSARVTNRSRWHRSLAGSGRYGHGEQAMTTAPTAPAYRLRLPDPDRVAVSVAPARHASMLALLREVAAGSSAGDSTQLAAAISRQLRPTARFALTALGPAGAGLVPDCATPIPPPTEVPVAVQAQRLRELPGATLTAELEQTFGSGLPVGWRLAADHPRRWLHALAAASLDAWEVSERRWRDCGPLLDREVRRVGVAVVRGGLDALLNNLHPRIRYADGTVALTARCTAEYDLAGRRLVLVPMIAGPGAVFAGFELRDVAYLAYPAGRVNGADTAGGDALTLILGAPRAAILRQLRHPCTVQQIAVAVRCAPNTATYHCQQLETAGLVTRRREQRAVWMTRTTRGAELLDLLSG